MSFLKRPKRAAVLGCGPAGLFAAHALVQAGWNVSIFSKKRRSEMFGAQYLHAEIPGLSGVMNTVSYSLRGSAEDYARKVYEGLLEADKVSPTYLSGVHRIWDIREAYYKAWDLYNGLVTSMRMEASSIPALKQSFPFVLSSVPAPALCANMEGRHNFFSQPAWAIGDAPERGISCPIEVPSFNVVCNGLPNPSWYRASNVFDYKTAEWPISVKPPIANVSQIVKPIGTSCDCYVDRRFIRIGRFGTWRKGVLSHEAYLTAKELTGI